MIESSSRGGGKVKYLRGAAAVLMVVSLLTVQSSAYRDELSTYISSITSISPTADETAVLNAVNAVRLARGLDALEYDPLLTDAARVRSAEIAESGVFSHTSPNYGDVFILLHRMRVRYRAAGENLARGFYFAADIAGAWMASPSHRDNIVCKTYTRAGVGIVNGCCTLVLCG